MSCKHKSIREYAVDRLLAIVFGASDVPRLQVVGLTIHTKNKDKKMLRTAITTEQLIDAVLAPVTDSGKKARLDGPASWEVTAGSDLVSVLTSPKGLVGRIVSNDEGLQGTATIVITADADLGDGTKTITETIEVEVTSPLAANVGASVLSAKDKPSDGSEVETPEDPAEEGNGAVASLGVSAKKSGK